MKRTKNKLVCLLRLLVSGVILLAPLNAYADCSDEKINCDMGCTNGGAISNNEAFLQCHNACSRKEQACEKRQGVTTHWPFPGGYNSLSESQQKEGVGQVKTYCEGRPEYLFVLSGKGNPLAGAAFLKTCFALNIPPDYNGMKSLKDSAITDYTNAKKLRCTNCPVFITDSADAARKKELDKESDQFWMTLDEMMQRLGVQTNSSGEFRQSASSQPETSAIDRKRQEAARRAEEKKRRREEQARQDEEEINRLKQQVANSQNNIQKGLATFALIAKVDEVKDKQRKEEQADMAADEEERRKDAEASAQEEQRKKKIAQRDEQARQERERQEQARKEDARREETRLERERQEQARQEAEERQRIEDDWIKMQNPGYLQSASQGGSAQTRLTQPSPAQQALDNEMDEKAPCGWRCWRDMAWNKVTQPIKDAVGAVKSVGEFLSGNAKCSDPGAHPTLGQKLEHNDCTANSIAAVFWNPFMHIDLISEHGDVVGRDFVQERK